MKRSMLWAMFALAATALSLSVRGASAQVPDPGRYSGSATLTPTPYGDEPNASGKATLRATVPEWGPIKVSFSVSCTGLTPGKTYSVYVDNLGPVGDVTANRNGRLTLKGSGTIIWSYMPKYVAVDRLESTGLVRVAAGNIRW